MEIKDYEKILDSMSTTGIYVMREDDHRILYFNRHVQEVTPDIQKGMVCHELWGDSCTCCPLQTIENRQENRSVNFNHPFGKIVDVVATRILWNDSVPAFVVTVSPHVEEADASYRSILRINLTQDRYEIIRLSPSAPDDGEKSGIFSSQMEHFVKRGNVHPDDVERFLLFSRPQHLIDAQCDTPKNLICAFRRRTSSGFRWCLMEFSPDSEYTESSRTAILYARDVHQILQEILQHEELTARSQGIIRTLSELNFDIYTIDLYIGTAAPVRVDGQMQNFLPSEMLPWNKLMRSHIKERLHKDYQEEFERKFSLGSLRRAQKDGEPKIEFLCQWQSGGTYRYIFVTAYFDRNRESERYMVLALEDADDRVRKELVRTQRDTQMAAIIKSRYSVINTLYPESGRCECISLEESGVPQIHVEDYAQHLKQILSESIYPKDADKVRQTLSLEHIREIAAKTADYSEEFCQYRLNTLPVQWIEQHIIYSRQKKDILVNILERNITDEKLEEENRRQATQEKVDLIHSLSSMFFATYYINLECNTFRSVTQLDEVGRLLGDELNYTAGLRTYADAYIHPDDRTEYLTLMDCTNLRQTLSAKCPFVAIEYRKIPQVPHTVPEKYDWVRATAVLADTSDDGTPRTALYVTQDVTESKQKEAREQRALQDACNVANQASASKSEFLSRMSHDIRTPLNGIIGMTAIAASHIYDPDKIHGYLNQIMTSSQRLLSMVNEVLDMSQIDSGKVDLAENKFTLSEIAHNLATFITPSIREKRHELLIHPIRVAHEAVIGDLKLLERVFANILGNAVIYTPPGGLIEMYVTEQGSKEYGYGHYDFTVKDNGIGMEQEFVKHIFDPFSRVEDSRISKVPGTGLGMTITQNIVRMMGGSIAIESTPNVGTTVTVSLLLRYQDNSENKVPQETSSSALPQDSVSNLSFEGHRILLVDDIDINREIAAEIIGSTGAKVETATNGREALEAFQTKENGYYSLIIMDIQMPVMNGYEATRAIRCLQRADAARIPIIAMSANGSTEDRLASRQAGMNEHLTKPLDIERLMVCMNRWINQNIS